MAKAKPKYRTGGVFVPRPISSSTIFSGDEKLLYGHIYSFKANGCWQKGPAICKALGLSPSRLKRCLRNLDKAGLLHYVAKGTKYRRMWAKDHPAFKAHQRAYKILHNDNLQGQICTPDNKEGKGNLLAHICTSTGPNMHPLQGQNRPPDKTSNTNKEYKVGEPSPMPAKEQAQASPETKTTKAAKLQNVKTKSEVEQKIRKFGKPVRKLQTVAEANEVKRANRMALGMKP